MPTYAYACTECDHRFEQHQAFSDAALTECPQCAGRLRKVFNSVGIVFKGSGFYRTDSRKEPVSASSDKSSEKTDKGTDKGSGKVAEKSSAGKGSTDKSGTTKDSGSSSGTSSSSGSDSASKPSAA